MNLKNRIAALNSGLKSKTDKLELERNLLSARFLSEIQLTLDSEELTRKAFAKKMGVSQSFISQLFTGDKTVSIDFLVKTQEKLNIKFVVSCASVKADNSIDNIFKNILEIEKDNSRAPQYEEDGYWAFFTNKKPDYKRSINNENESKLLAIA